VKLLLWRLRVFFRLLAYYPANEFSIGYLWDVSGDMYGEELAVRRAGATRMYWTPKHAVQMEVTFGDAL
jgi:hypothetical protein